jgi:hypothetical protein
MSELRTRLEAELAAAEADVARLRAENSVLAEAFRVAPSDAGKEGLKRGAASLSAARDRVEAAKAALLVFERTGGEHGLVAEGGRVIGTLALVLRAGITRAEREKLIDDALGGPLHDAATELGVLVATAPDRFVRERPGRDAEGRTILDVIGRVEGDVLVPAVSTRQLRRA